MNIHKKNDWVELSSVHKTYKMNNYAKASLNGKKYLNMLCIQINKRMLLPSSKVLMAVSPHISIYHAIALWLTPCMNLSGRQMTILAFNEGRTEVIVFVNSLVQPTLLFSTQIWVRHWHWSWG